MYPQQHKSRADAILKPFLGSIATSLVLLISIHKKKYKKADKVLQRVLFLDDSIGDYWDSLAEVYSLQRKDSFAVVNLAVALKCSKKLPVVSVESYRKDPRWQRLRKRADFQKLMEGS